MSTPPLTHHEIMALVAPFTRAGRRVDLAASDRLARRLAFMSREHVAGDGPALRETLHLDQPEADSPVLTRTLTLPSGLAATLQASGREPGALLAQLDAVAPASQFRCGEGFEIGYSQRFDATGRLLLTQAAARVDGIELGMSVPAVLGYPADVWLRCAEAEGLELPDDLFAVLGRPWSRLQRLGLRWTSTLRLPGKEAARSRLAEALWLQAVAHVARTLAETPQRYHERLAGARWRVALRRTVPLAAALGTIAAALAVPSLAIEQDSVLRMLVFNSPPLLLALFFSLKEMPRFELPRLPRPSKARAWRQPRR